MFFKVPSASESAVPIVIQLSFDSFQILNFAEPLTLPPGCWNVFSLKLSVKDTVTNVHSSICLSTNVGVMFEIPLQIYSTVSKVLCSVACVELLLGTANPAIAVSLSGQKSLLSPERKAQTTLLDHSEDCEVKSPELNSDGIIVLLALNSLNSRP